MQAEKLKVTWDQTTDEVLIKVPIAADVKGKDVKFEVHPKRLQLQAKSNTLLEGSLADAGEIDLDGEEHLKASYPAEHRCGSTTRDWPLHKRHCWSCNGGEESSCRSRQWEYEDDSEKLITAACILPP
jgi:hypothetical protein